MMYLRVHISFKDSHRNMKPVGEYIVGWLGLNGFNARETKFNDYFEVLIKKDGVRKTKERLEVFLLAVGFRNGMSFSIDQITDDSIYHSWVAVEPHEEFFINFIKLYKNSNFRDIVKKICEFNSQVEPRAQIIFGTSLLEEIFNKKPTHILSNRQIAMVTKTISTLKLNPSKKDKIVTLINNPDYLSKETRNERMSKGISKCLQENRDKTLERLRFIYKIRGKNAHTIKLDDSEKAIREIKCILEMYIFWKFRFVRTTGQILPRKKNGSKESKNRP